MAISSIRSSRWRSFLTISGIVIRVASVLLTVSIGEGAKQQLSNQNSKYGKDLITVRAGRPIKESDKGFSPSQLLFNRNNGQLSDEDVTTVSKSQNVRISAPLASINGIAEFENKKFEDGMIIATGKDLPELMSQDVKYGAFFGLSEEGRNVAVLGQDVVVELFDGRIPTGTTFKLRGEDFIVRGVFEQFDVNPLAPGGNFNKAIFIPYTTAKEINKGNLSVFEILAKPSSKEQFDTAKDSISKNLLKSHGGQEDFLVLTQDDNQILNDATLSLLTTMVAGIAAISLFVGGIGIMNIMLVSVTERMHEIGIRKAIGATNRQILGQFLIEAVVLSLFGSFLGVMVALAGNFGLRMTTELKPVISIPTVVAAVIVASSAGIIFGIAPAIKASRKDPIEALRNQ
jgi:putative ABC transport system permease protein